MIFEDLVIQCTRLLNHRGHDGSVWGLQFPDRRSEEIYDEVTEFFYDDKMKLRQYCVTWAAGKISFLKF